MRSTPGAQRLVRSTLPVARPVYERLDVDVERPTRLSSRADMGPLYSEEEPLTPEPPERRSANF